MQKLAIASVLAVAFALSGCGVHVAPTASSAALAELAAQSKKKTTKTKLDTPSYKAGLAAAAAKLNAPARQGVTPTGATFVAPSGMDATSYNYGYAMGLLQGALNAYSRINGSYDVYQWKTFAYMLQGSMTDAQAALQSDPAVSAKFGVALGILTGGLQSFNSANGDFDVNQWQSFSDSNRNVLQNALQAMQSAM